MSRRSKPPWWQIPAIIGSVVVGLGAAGTGVVKLAQFLTITDRVEASEAKNAEQDKSLEQLSYIAGQNQAILDRITQTVAPNQAAQAAPRPLPPVEEWYDAEGRRWTCDPGRYDCANTDNWIRDP